MKIQLLPSTFDQQGRATQEQRLTCYLIDDCVAFDAGSIALAITDSQRDTVRDIIVTHPHLDHIATLPIYIDDLFGFLENPIRIHATEEVINLLERDVFNWTVYPRFSELKNDRGPVMEYVPFKTGVEFEDVRGAVGQNHEPGIQDAFVRSALRRDFAQHRLEDIDAHSREQSLAGDANRTIRAHAARIGSRVTFAEAFVILRRRQDHDAFAVGQAEDR